MVLLLCSRLGWHRLGWHRLPSHPPSEHSSPVVFLGETWLFWVHVLTGYACMQNPINEAHEQEEATLQNVLAAAEEVERCGESLRAAEYAAQIHSDQNAGDLDRINREVGVHPVFPPPAAAHAARVKVASSSPHPQGVEKHMT